MSVYTKEYVDSEIAKMLLRQADLSEQYKERLISRQTYERLKASIRVQRAYIRRHRGYALVSGKLNDATPEEIIKYGLK